MSGTSYSNSLTRGYVICFIATVIWSSTAIFIRYLTVNFQMPALLLAFWRDLLVSAGLLLTYALLNPALLRVSRGEMRFLASYGLALSLFNSLWTISVALNGAAVSTVLAYSSAAFTAILGWRLFSEHLDGPKLVAVTLSLVGCAFVAGAFDPNAWQVNLLGVVTGLASGVGFAAYSLFGKAASLRRMNSLTVLFYTFAWAAAFICIYNLIPAIQALKLGSTSIFWLGKSANGWVMLILLALGPTIGGYGLYTISLNYLPASVANLIATLEPSMTAALAYFFLGERLSTPQFFGSLLIIAGVIILRIYEGRVTASALA